jgi:glycosyltransferase involved in cell wall biosynthesis
MARFKEWLGKRYHEWEWRQRLHSYRVRAAISHFAQEWTQRWWGIDCAILYPPVETDFQESAKGPTILSVGRFTPVKKQLELVGAYQTMNELHAQGWRFVCAGGMGTTPEDRLYLDKVRSLGANSPVNIRSDIDRTELKSLYEGARIFWHGAGLGEDENAHPELTEHFGIVTVEAMAAGCVPVVIDKGGQPELVEHGVNGFLWHTVEELKRYTMLLARDETLRERLAGAARLRAQAFSKETFVRRFASLVTPILPQPLLADDLGRE